MHGEMVSVTARKKSKMGKHAMRVTFEKAGNGMTSSTMYPQMDDDGKESPYGGTEEKMIHPSMAHAKKHLMAMMGHSFPSTGAPSTKGTDGGETPSTAKDGTKDVDADTEDDE